MLFAGFGVETQRHFYKKVFLFASIDLVGGYGNGKEQSFSEIFSNNQIAQGFAGTNSPNFIEKNYSRDTKNASKHRRGIGI